ncbi:unnamed protein product [Acanthosepion pharaonis]|uniref:Uncharacterized protein n=1 Tax=Acanthosepion pharaonis TaxID=158019 RepID=A0A812AHK1_ACAPH|nr:unnamed protein product [Sepia pharaonis]
MLNRLCSATDNLTIEEDNGIQALQEICDIMRSSDVSPFEVIHSGLVTKLLQYLTANSGIVIRDERIRRFLHVFLNCPIHYQTAPCNEVRSIFALLMELLLLKDPLQLKRLKWAVIDGHVNEKGKKFEGLLSTIRSFHLSDSSRSYQCIKFLVQLCNRCSLVKDQLMKTSSKWQWAVKWLEKKMSDYWAPSSTVPLSNEDSNQKSFQRTVSAQVSASSLYKS